MIRFEGSPIPPPDPKLKRAAALPGGKDRPSVTPALEAKAERITAPLSVTKKHAVTNSPSVTNSPAKAKAGRPRAIEPSAVALRVRALRERRKVEV